MEPSQRQLSYTISGATLDPTYFAYTGNILVLLNPPGADLFQRLIFWQFG